MIWVLGILIVCTVAALVYGLTSGRGREKREDLRRRYAIDESDARRIPLAEAAQQATPASSDQGDLIFGGAEPGPARTVSSNWLGDLAREEPLAPAPPPIAPVVGRIVQTPDGETVLTTPPFALRPQMVTNRLGRFVNGLSKRLPAWVVACPRVRLESLVTPTPPDGRDPEDWSQWRRRVRVRAVDVVLCDRRTWKPLLAIMLKPSNRAGRNSGTNGTVAALAIAGGQDRMIEEVLGHVGLTMVHVSGKIADDWPLIQPYVDESILKSGSDEDIMTPVSDSTLRPDPDAAVKLLRMDGEKGWLLE